MGCGLCAGWVAPFDPACRSQPVVFFWPRSVRQAQRGGFAGALVLTPAALAFLLADPPLRVEPRLLGGATRLGRSTLLRNDERRANQVREAQLRTLAILALTPAIARHDAEIPVRVEPRRKLLQQALTLFVSQRSRSADVNG